jgi:hypothetical protein
MLGRPSPRNTAPLGGVDPHTTIGTDDRLTILNKIGLLIKAAPIAEALMEKDAHQQDSLIFTYNQLDPPSTIAASGIVEQTTAQPTCQSARADSFFEMA